MNLFNDSAHVFFSNGREITVKNLRWLLDHAGEAQRIEIRANGLNGNEASLIVTGDGWVYYTPFASVTVLREWLHRSRALHGIPQDWGMTLHTTLRDLRAAARWDAQHAGR